MKKKLNVFTVSGLMTGPILGSGIIFLPPLAYDKLGQYAIFAWLIMMSLNCLFAYVFAKMTITASDNRGISAVVGDTFGTRFGALAANYLTAAVFFGPVAVALTASEFILPAGNELNTWKAAGAVLLICAVIVISGVSIMGKFMLVLSSITAGLLLAGSGATLFQLPALTVPGSLPAPGDFGQTLLLIFWAIVGWEILGNYVEDVENPKLTIMRAMLISLTAVVLVYLLTAFAFQNSPSHSMPDLLIPVTGRFSKVVFSGLAAGLCICTISTFTGGVVRQTTVRFKNAGLPEIFHHKWMIALMLLIVDYIVLFLHAAGILSFQNIIGIANAMFIGNAVLDLACGFKLLNHILIRIGIGILLFLLLLIFLFSSGYALVLFLVITCASLILPVPIRKPVF
ncbi:amino acid permease [Clostridium boliviensis]|uniref:Amino acid permease n=1 Tax=Clostridium boliviensis TaxID=318465 RepID=A0ABU4GNR3_9CLOT|nr:amino acid permease [Clostridium boliviensis]MDW2799262.1 amino acid permease [Clostridium boliviensis]